LRRGNVLLSLIVLPLAMPLLIFGAGATDRALSGVSPMEHCISWRAVGVHVHAGSVRATMACALRGMMVEKHVTWFYSSPQPPYVYGVAAVLALGSWVARRWPWVMG